MIAGFRKQVLLCLLLAGVLAVLEFEWLPQTPFLDKNQRILLLTAHPDDECMFFGPTLTALVHAEVPVFSLCLSTGDSDGLGQVRSLELQMSLKVLGIPRDRSEVIDHHNLQDSITKSWNPDLISDIVGRFAEMNNITTVLTFDNGGVSGHPNHISLFSGASRLLRSQPEQHMQLYALRTVPLSQKYTGFFAHLSAKFRGTFLKSESPSHLTVVANMKGYQKALRAMYQHWSQLVWFRWLYVLFSQYMWVNEWVAVPVT